MGTTFFSGGGGGGGLWLPDRIFSPAASVVAARKLAGLCPNIVIWGKGAGLQPTAASYTYAPVESVFKCFIFFIVPQKIVQILFHKSTLEKH